jgi:hypothetical protein
MVFLRPSRVAHGTHITAVRLWVLSRMILCHIARHAHHCRSPAGLALHDLVSYRTAGTAFLEKLFLRGFWGFEFWDASVAMGGSD